MPINETIRVYQSKSRLQLRLAVAVAAIVALAHQNSRAQAVFEPSVPLERVVAGAPLIVEARPGTPRGRTEHHPIRLDGDAVTVAVHGVQIAVKLDKSSDVDAKKVLDAHPSWASFGESYVITRVLRGKAKRGQTLCAFPAGWRDSARRYLEYYFTGSTRKSPSVPKYHARSQSKVRNKDTRILFLSAGPGGCHAYSIAGGYEHVSKRRAVRKLISAAKKK